MNVVTTIRLIPKRILFCMKKLWVRNHQHLYIVGKDITIKK